jgi:hypothetical protein
MSQNSHVDALKRALSLDDLTRRQETLRAEIRQQRRGLLGLVVELRRVDEAIRRGERRAPPVPEDVRLAGRLIAETGGISHLVIEAFGDAARALTSKDIARQVLTRLGLDPENRAVMVYMTQRVCTSLWTLKQSGAVSKAVKTGGSLQLWACGTDHLGDAPPLAADTSGITAGRKASHRRRTIAGVHPKNAFANF